MRRRGRPSLIGTAARTAVIAGTATAVSGNVARSMAPPPGAPHQPLPPPQAAAPAGLTPEGIAKLQQLGELHKAGVLTADEFAKAKAQVLG